MARSGRFRWEPIDWVADIRDVIEAHRPELLNEYDAYTQPHMPINRLPEFLNRHFPLPIPNDSWGTRHPHHTARELARMLDRPKETPMTELSSRENARLDERYRIAALLDDRANAEAIQVAAYMPDTAEYRRHVDRAQLIRDLAKLVRDLPCL